MLKRSLTLKRWYVSDMRSLLNMTAAGSSRIHAHIGNLKMAVRRTAESH